LFNVAASSGKSPRGPVSCARRIRRGQFGVKGFSMIDDG